MRHQKSSISNNGPQFRAQDKKKGEENVQEKNSRTNNILSNQSSSYSEYIQQPSCIHELHCLPLSSSLPSN